jgi:hypothetical protein
MQLSRNYKALCLTLLLFSFFPNVYVWICMFYIFLYTNSDRSVIKRHQFFGDFCTLQKADKLLQKQGKNSDGED